MGVVVRRYIYRFPHTNNNTLIPNLCSLVGFFRGWEGDGKLRTDKVGGPPCPPICPPYAIDDCYILEVIEVNPNVIGPPAPLYVRHMLLMTAIYWR